MRPGEPRASDLEYAIRLETAIWRARPQCRECGNRRVTVEWRPDLHGYIPVSHHFTAGPDDSCAVLAGGLAAWRSHEDLWAALDPYLAPCGGVYGGYGETSLTARQLTGAVA